MGYEVKLMKGLEAELRVRGRRERKGQTKGGNESYV